MKLKLITITLFCYAAVYSQTPELFSYKLYKSDSLSGIAAVLPGYKIHLIGKAPERSENLKLRNTYLAFLHKNRIYPKYILCEEGESICFFRNLYFDTGDSTFLYMTESDETSISLYENLRTYNLSLPEEQRFSFQSVDQESSLLLVHLAISYLLRTHLDEYKKDPKYASNYDLQIMLRVIADKENPNLWAGKFLKEDVDNIKSILAGPDAAILEKGFGPKDFNVLKKIIAGYDLAKKGKDRLSYEWESEAYKQERETFLANAVYSLFRKDTAAYFLGQLETVHTRLDFNERLKGPALNYSMAGKLNSDSLYTATHQRIYSSFIYYRDLSKGYYFLNDKKQELDMLYKTIPKGSAYFFDPKKKICNSLLLFKED